MRELREELVEFLLSLIELTTSSVVNAKECHNAVDDQKPILVADKELCDFVQELHLMLRVNGTGICDIVLRCKVSAQTLTRRRDYRLVSGSTPKRSAI